MTQRMTFLGLFFAALLLAALNARAGELPLTVANITLGEHYTKYADITEPGTATPMSDALYLSEIRISENAIAGVRGGSLTYGNCAAPGRVLRVKLKFTDRSEKLYKKLLKLYNKRFGKAGEWQGDAFNIIKAWQWEVIENGEKLTFTLAHSEALDYRPGVSVKMTHRSWLQDEYTCWQRKHPDEDAVMRESSKTLELEDFVPH